MRVPLLSAHRDYSLESRSYDFECQTTCVRAASPKRGRKRLRSALTARTLAHTPASGCVRGKVTRYHSLAGCSVCEGTLRTLAGCALRVEYLLLLRAGREWVRAGFGVSVGGCSNFWVLSGATIDSGP